MNLNEKWDNLLYPSKATSFSIWRILDLLKLKIVIIARLMPGTWGGRFTLNL